MARGTRLLRYLCRGGLTDAACQHLTEHFNVLPTEWFFQVRLLFCIGLKREGALAAVFAELCVQPVTGGCEYMLHVENSPHSWKCCTWGSYSIYRYTGFNNSFSLETDYR